MRTLESFTSLKLFGDHHSVEIKAAFPSAEVQDETKGAGTVTGLISVYSDGADGTY